MTPFLLDTNFFIDAHRKGFPMDVVPSFWKALKELAEAGKVVSIDKVKSEIFKHEDDLKAWCEGNLPEDFFKNTTEAIVEYSEVVNWAYSKKNDPYNQKALDIFMDAEEADAWLIAFAKKHSYPLVTHEISAPLSQNSIKIPDACHPFGVRTVQQMVMFRELGVKI